MLHNKGEHMLRHDQPSRRSILKSAAAGAIAMAGAPIVKAAMKADSKTIVIGSGAHTYEVIDNWAGRPDDKPWGNTHMVQEVGDGRIFVHHTGPESVHVYDPDGKFIEAWGAEMKGGAHGMDLRAEGGEEFLYFAPTGQKRILKTNLKGERVFEFGFPQEAKNADRQPCYEPADPKFVPTFIAFAPGDKGDFYVADGYGSNYIHRYDINGKYKSTFGGTGSGEGQLKCPHGIWCDTRDPASPMLVVADRANVRLQWFTLDGKFVKMVSDELRHPCHFDQRDGDLLIPDLHGRVTIFDKDNKLITHLGDNSDPAKRGKNGVKPEELIPGEFCTPHGAIWDRAGNIYVAEWLPYGRVTKLKRVA
jgi:hypothetical protein